MIDNMTSLISPMLLDSFASLTFCAIPLFDSGYTFSGSLCYGVDTNALLLYNFICHEHHDLYVILCHPETPSYLKDLAIKYGLTSQLWEHGIKAFVEHLGRQKANNLHEMRAFLVEARDMMSQFIKDIPAMEDEWRKIIANIKEYDKNLEKLQRQMARSKKRKKSQWDTIRNDPPDRQPWTSKPTQGADSHQCPLHGSSESLTTPSEAPNISPLSCLSDGMLTLPVISPPNDQFTADNAPQDDLPPLPEYVISTLMGWLWYGQAITIDKCYNEGFNMYCKVYSALSLAGEWVRENLKPAFSFWK